MTPEEQFANLQELFARSVKASREADLLVLQPHTRAEQAEALQRSREAKKKIGDYIKEMNESEATREEE